MIGSLGDDDEVSKKLEIAEWLISNGMPSQANP